ncbi:MULTISPECIES: GIY-YIG nuclease family protein [Burkholderia]|uniref:GIY-YIG nuclease family protein n=1 Tax=Burkholderia sp. MSMB1588 TaxID=1636423 RepID=UPI000327EE24|nr:MULTISPECIES: GIY-YIG nuclease family protein [Burkholderia]AGK47177.1 hypothetical protein BTI_2811 [Burkholderia thailandensis MSMB121]ATF34530.1 GIY-YIG nuclease family protein [Burkholderia thailandensis]KST75105.1 excinuclease [Burkholderia humptydooensis]KVN11095.1 excinuclease [Burkholderia sp. MSMB1552]KWZ55163.1 excinuclease [Burkholderia sp. MSMB1588]
MSWYLYLIECADGSVYTGITTDVAARFDKHAQGVGARYTRARKPRAVLASFELADRSSASRAEYWVKRLTAAQKRELAAGARTLESVLPVVAAVAPGDADEDRGAAAVATTDVEAHDAAGRMTLVDADRAAGMLDTPGMATPRSRRDAARASPETPDAGAPADTRDTTEPTKPSGASHGAKTIRATASAAPPRRARAKQNRAAS